MSKSSGIIQQVTISRTSQREGIAYEVTSEISGVSFQVLSEIVKKSLFAGISSLTGTQLTFQNPDAAMRAFVAMGGPPFIRFWSMEGENRGEAKQAAFSVMGKTIVEDEDKNHLGAICWGMKKHRLVFHDNEEIGFIIRAPKNKPPIIMKPSQAYLLDRFEFTNQAGKIFDWRLIYTFIAMRVFQECESNGS